ncbi:hypothetical protein D9758_018314 [Tetrapyrgos nigripes]|uniref:Uncharacterized protein n=1 Tax=Tetrapyrgos nigripes TaxID=182062 RepID=A0A8H5FA83_9AGAR|nr:hypothetical protein D9758_018314 [Tetrapyrgos nigripes]
MVAAWNSRSKSRFKHVIIRSKLQRQVVLVGLYLPNDRNVWTWSGLGPMMSTTTTVAIEMPATANIPSSLLHDFGPLTLKDKPLNHHQEPKECQAVE